MKSTKVSLNIKEICVFSMLGAIMFISKMLMEWIPNVHLLSLLIATYTAVYRAKALIPVYIYVFLDGLIHGFNTWWIPYLYIWTLLWLGIMLLPKGMTMVKLAVCVTAVCFIHGLLFGTMYAPFQAIMYKMNFKTMIAWIVAGLPFDVIHSLSNLAFSLLFIPLTKLICKLDNKPLPYIQKVIKRSAVNDMHPKRIRACGVQFINADIFWKSMRYICLTVLQSS